MHFKINRLGFITFIKSLVIGLFVVISTFPENDWSITVGIDSPLSWAFNFFFSHGLSLGKDIVFPHGPLAFVMYPTLENILLATLIISILKILIVFNILGIIDYLGKTKWFIAFIFAYLVSTIANINYLLLVNIILLYLNYYNNEKWKLKFGAFILTAFAFYVKSDVAIISSIICVSFLANYFLVNKDYKKLILDILTLLGLMLLIWFLMYKTFSGFINYIIGMYNLAQDNSSAVSDYPYNNWWILSLSLIILFLIPFINKTKKALFFSILVTLSLFAAWKHGMAREDIMHFNGFVAYVLILLFTFILFNKQKAFLNSILSFLVISLLTINMKYSNDNLIMNYELFRINNFVEFVTDFSKLKTKAQNETEKNISKNKLPKSLLDSIKSNTIDVYPWDYSIIAANNLNWQPRVVIQSYASYTSWLDKRNALHFNSDKSPTFLIWELNKITRDVNGSDLNSLDERYLLNDEPQTIEQILKSYKPYYNDTKFMVFKKKDANLITKGSIIANNTTQWNKWNQVPNTSNGLLRLKFTFKKSLLESLKSFFYKDEQFWIYLKFSNNIIHKYRIIPENAKDGIWINPYIFNATDKHIAPLITEVMFKCSNGSIMNNNLKLVWEKIEFNNEPDYINKFFNKTDKSNDSVYFSSINTFEEPKTKYWDKVPSDQTKYDDYKSNSKSQVLDANSSSVFFTFPLDSLPFNKLRITTDCWVKSKDYIYTNNSLLVISIEDRVRNIIWKSIPIDIQLIDNNQWNNIFNFIEYNHNITGCTLKINLWNKSNIKILVDDFRVLITNNN